LSPSGTLIGAAGEFISDGKITFRVAADYARATSLGKPAPPGPRHSCARLCRNGGGKWDKRI